MSSPLGDLDSRVSWKYWGWADKYPRTNTILRQHTRPGLLGSRARVAEIGQQRRCAKPGITAVRGLPGPTLAPGPQGCGLTHSPSLHSATWGWNLRPRSWRGSGAERAGVVPGLGTLGPKPFPGSLRSGTGWSTPDSC